MKLTVIALSVVGTFAAFSAEAATLATYTHSYGIGQFDPQGTDVLANGLVTVSDRSSARFEDSFDFSTLAYDSIDNLSLSLSFDNAGPRVFIVVPVEAWKVRVPGTVAGSARDDRFDLLADFASPQSFNYSARTDTTTGRDAFAQSLATQEFRFGFSEFTFGTDRFDLASATLTIEGAVSPVPLPAAGFLLFGGLGAFAALRRRRKPAV